MDIYDPISLALGIEPIHTDNIEIPPDAKNTFGGGLSPTSFKSGCTPWNKGIKCPDVAERAKQRWVNWRESNPNYKDKWKRYQRTGWSEQELHRRSLAAQQRNNTTIECPHCKKTGNIGNMKRWHFDKCNTRLIESD